MKQKVAHSEDYVLYVLCLLKKNRCVCASAAQGRPLLSWVVVSLKASKCFCTTKGGGARQSRKSMPHQTSM